MVATGAVALQIRGSLLRFKTAVERFALSDRRFVLPVHGGSNLHCAPMSLPSSQLPLPPPANGTRRQSSLSFLLSGVMFVIYFGFVLLVAYAKPFLGSTLVPGLSWGILLGALVIVTAWVLTLVYVVSANRKGGV